MLIKKFTASAVIAAFAAWVLIAAAAGCAPASQGPVSTPAQKEKSKMEYRQNPNPTKAHQLIMRIDNAPGEFGWMHGFMQYDVTNRECLPPPDENHGHLSPIPTRSVEFDLTQESPGEYSGIVYTDGMIDEDYHGRGVCRWKLMNVQVQLKATGTEGETLFMADIFGEELLAGKTKTLYFWKGGYPHSSVRDFPDSGETDQDKFKLELRDDLFTITLGAKEIAP